MSRTLWIDAQVGAAGDMLLAALVELGADPERLCRELVMVVPDASWKLVVENTRRGPFTAARLVSHGFPRESGHVHRPWSRIREQIASAGIPARARDRAMSAYEALATAEARIHGVPVDQVELHEVGAKDAIGDIVGVCLALEHLDVDRVVATPLPMGTGFIETAHGRIPLPAPATLEVLRGWPVVSSPWPGEWVTPTAAALIATLASPGPLPSMRPLASAFGAGARDPEQVANVVRLVLGEALATPAKDTVLLLETNIDDMIPEHLPPLIDALMKRGALDAWVTPIQMKQGRPGWMVQVLARRSESEQLTEHLLAHSSTLGVRTSERHRDVLDRWFETVDTAYGPIRVKIGGRDRRPWHWAPEHADVLRAATEHRVPLARVHQAALSACSHLAEEAAR